MRAEIRECGGTERLGLAAQLHQVAMWVNQQVGLPVLVGDQPSTEEDPGPASYAQIRTVRLAVPAAAGDPCRAKVEAHLLITVHADDHAQASDAVANLLLAAIDEARWEIAPDQPDLQLWKALRLPPEPAFMINISVQVPLVRHSAPPVGGPVKLINGELRRVQGRVLRANGRPVAGAQIRLRGWDSVMTTAYDGRWTLVVPNTAVQLDITASGVNHVYEVPGSPNSAADAHCDIDIVLAAAESESHTGS